MSLYNVQNKKLEGYLIGASSMKEFEQIIFGINSITQIQDIPFFKYKSVNENLIDPRRWNY